jgi:transketolase N-terminal domain/subunit
MNETEAYGELEALSRRGRWLAISSVAHSGAGHVGGPFSAMDLMVALYFKVMRIDPQNPAWPERDRFILSKGHSSIGQYSVMALRGFLPIEELGTFDKGNSRLQGHPDVTKLPGLDTSTGSLGQGLSVGLGMALGARLRGSKFHTFVMIGDGELQEGMIWEALHIAPRYKLGNLTAILAKEGISAGVLHVPSIKPISTNELVKACEGAKVIVTVEEHSIYGGLGGMVAEILSERSPRKVVRVGIKDRAGESAPNDFLLDLFDLSPSRLSERVKKIIHGAR